MALQIRSGEYRGQQGFKLSGKVKGYVFPVKIFAKKKETVQKIKELYLSGKSREEIRDEISKLLRSESVETMSQYEHLRESLQLEQRRTPLDALWNKAQQYSQDLDRTLQRIRGMQQSLDDGSEPAKRQFEKAYDKLILTGDRVSKLADTAAHSVRTGDPDVLSMVDMLAYYTEGWRFQKLRSMENKAARTAKNKVRASISTASAVRSMITSIIDTVEMARGPRETTPTTTTPESGQYESLVKEFGLEEAAPIKTMIKQTMPKGWAGEKQQYWKQLHLLANEVQDLAFFATAQDENWEQAASRLDELITRVKKLKSLAEKIKKS